MTIKILQRLQQGSNWEKISKSWRTTRLIEEIGSLIRQIGYVTPTDVLREGN